MVLELGSSSNAIADIAKAITPDDYNQYKDASRLPAVVVMALLIKADGDAFALEVDEYGSPVPHPRCMFTTRCRDGVLLELYFEVYNGTTRHRSRNLRPWKTSRQVQLCLETLVEAEWLPQFNSIGVHND